MLENLILETALSSRKNSCALARFACNALTNAFASVGVAERPLDIAVSNFTEVGHCLLHISGVNRRQTDVEATQAAHYKRDRNCSERVVRGSSLIAKKLKNIVNDLEARTPGL